MEIRKRITTSVFATIIGLGASTLNAADMTKWMDEFQPSVLTKAEQKAASKIAVKEEKLKKPKMVKGKFKIPKAEYRMLKTLSSSDTFVGITRSARSK